MSEAAPDQSTDAGGTSAEGGGAPFEIPEYLKRGDIALALGVIAILVVLLLPMPTWLLDFSLAISITFSVVILMTVLFIKNPLELNTFPTILLIATMLRLALNLQLPTVAAGSRGVGQIQRIVLHTIEGTAQSGINTFLNPESQVSAHYIVDFDGTATAPEPPPLQPCCAIA